MVHRVFPRSIRLAVWVAVVFGLGAGCASDTSLVSSLETATTSPYVAQRDGAGDTTHMAILAQGATLADAQLVAETARMNLITFKKTSGLAVFSGAGGNVQEMTHSPMVEAFEIVRKAEVTDPIDLFMVFMEGEWDDDAVVGQRGLDRLHFPTVHDHAEGTGIRVATLDTGAFFAHPHLSGRMIDIPVDGLDSAGEEKNGIDDDQDGLVDEGFGHGTHVAGLILTCAPNATVWPIKVLNDDGAGTTLSIALGLNAVLEHGADIVNMSFRMGEVSPALDKMFKRLREQGVVLMAAAGNDGGAPVYPARSLYTVAVAATGPSPSVDPDNPLDPSDAYDPAFDSPTAWTTLADYSAYGPQVQIAAPGSHLLSSYPSVGGAQRSASGTSMACAVASGVWACVGGSHDRPRPQEAIDRMFSVADYITPDPTVIQYGSVSPTRCLMLIPTVH